MRKNPSERLRLAAWIRREEMPIDPGRIDPRADQLRGDEKRLRIVAQILERVGVEAERDVERLGDRLGDLPREMILEHPIDEAAGRDRVDVSIHFRSRSFGDRMMIEEVERKLPLGNPGVHAAKQLAVVGVEHQRQVVGEIVPLRIVHHHHALLGIEESIARPQRIGQQGKHPLAARFQRFAKRDEAPKPIAVRT